MTLWHIFGIIVAVEILASGLIDSDLVAPLVIRFLSRWFPELREFRSPRGARAHWNMEFNGRMTRWIILSTLVIPILAVVNFLLRLDPRLVVVLIGTLWLPGTLVLMLAFNRRAIRTSLRRSLLYEGTEFCRVCGYRLNGVESANCPECNEPRRVKLATGTPQ
ncbi:MAG TPA: hypothetical protein P5081_21430 [Phycisphaerae bacterium]|nr:hypothetical protein [Phycisphaerae bacterium]HRW55444.1 hypothetical protein [Phycisphaerae bacterium]